jgi:hypothetical protein
MNRKTDPNYFAASTTPSPPIIMMMEDARIYNIGIYIIYADFKGAFNVTDMSESGTDSFTLVVPAPQGGRLW